MSAPTVETLLLQAQALLNEADEANHSGAPITESLQRQARELLAEAIDSCGDRAEAMELKLRENQQEQDATACTCTITPHEREENRTCPVHFPQGGAQ